MEWILCYKFDNPNWINKTFDILNRLGLRLLNYFKITYPYNEETFLFRYFRTPRIMSALLMPSYAIFSESYLSRFWTIEINGFFTLLCFNDWQE